MVLLIISVIIIGKIMYVREFYILCFLYFFMLLICFKNLNYELFVIFLIGEYKVFFIISIISIIVKRFCLVCFIFLCSFSKNVFFMFFSDKFFFFLIDILFLVKKFFKIILLVLVSIEFNVDIRFSFLDINLYFWRMFLVDRGCIFFLGNLIFIKIFFIVLSKLLLSFLIFFVGIVFDWELRWLIDVRVVVGNVEILSLGGCEVGLKFGKWCVLFIEIGVCVVSKGGEFCCVIWEL